MTTNLLLTFLLPLVVLITCYTTIMRKLMADQSPAKSSGTAGGTVLQVKAFQTKHNGCSGSSSPVNKKSPSSAAKKLSLVVKSSADGTAVLTETTTFGSAESSADVTAGEGLRAHGGTSLKSGSVVNLRKSANANRSKVKI